MFLILLFTFFANAELVDLPVINPQLFEVGQSWTWAYSEKDKETQQWLAPYLYEQYTLVAIDKNIFTFEMASSSSFPVESPAHHMFKVDLNKCLTSLKVFEKNKPWFIQFYSKTYSPHWELVSKSHSPLAFIEKFNCAASAQIQSVEWLLVQQKEGFQFTKPGWPSVYGRTTPYVAGVAILKNFREDYKFELVY